MSLISGGTLLFSGVLCPSVFYFVALYSELRLLGIVLQHWRRKYTKHEVLPHLENGVGHFWWMFPGLNMYMD